MAQAKTGDRIQFNFTGTLEDGVVFDTTFESDDCDSEDCADTGCADDGCGCGSEVGPMEIEIGAEEFFPLVEEALIGMAPGEKKTLTVLAADACGDYDDELIFKIEREKFFGEDVPAIGDDLELTGEDEETTIVTVIAVEGNEVTLDANHPLAGEDLVFDIELVAIVEK